MNKQTMGIHHITAIVGHPQENVDFYAGVLGLRLVKKTVNFDDPETYHILYFGNEGGKPGTIITFFLGLMPTKEKMAAVRSASLLMSFLLEHCPSGKTDLKNSKFYSQKQSVSVNSIRTLLR